MGVIRSSQCHHCGAPIEFGDEAITRCGYCNYENRWIAPTPAPQQQPQWGPPQQPQWGPPHGPPQGAPQIVIQFPQADPELLARRAQAIATASKQASKGSAAVGCVALGILLSTIGIVGVSAWTSKKGGARSLVAEPNESVSWGLSAPAVLDVDGDGTDDIVGLVKDDGSDQPTFVMAFDGATFDKLWEQGPYGKWSGAGLEIVASGTRVVLTAPDGSARILEAKSGKEVASQKLSDAARGLCVDPATSLVHVALADEKHLVVDAAKGSFGAAPLSPHCTERLRPQTYQCASARGPQSMCLDGSRVKASGFRGDYVLREGSTHVVLGRREPGTPLPMIAGGTMSPGTPPTVDPLRKRPLNDFDRERWLQDDLGKRLTLSWQKSLGTGDASQGSRSISKWVAQLEGGVLTVAYPSSNKNWNIARFDAATGAGRWDVALPQIPSDPNGMLLRGDRIYVWKWTHLFVLDAKTGKLVDMIGPTFWLDK